MALLAVKPPLNSKSRATVLPLHIDTTSFTNPPQTYPWRRIANKRQLPALILLVLLIFSISTNLVQHGRHHKYTNTTHNNNAVDFLPNHSTSFSDRHHAIIVAGHAIYKGDPSSTLVSPGQEGSSIYKDDDWILEPFQRGGQVTTFIKHIEKGIELAKSDPNAVLIFSGGQTRAEAGPRSEGQSYWMIAEALEKNNIETESQNENENENETENNVTNNINNNSILSRMLVEDHARDSYENVLFSLCRFYEMTGEYPSRVTIVGFEFKRKRFQDLHMHALRFPIDRFEYIGIDPPFDLEAASDRIAGENANSFGPFSEDLYGCHAPLSQKRLDRNPFRRKHPYSLTCPDLSNLINYCPSNNALFPGPLPWV
ncbi:hypothetical protein BDA99DRAFT_491753 [Phascolomyces articulosus]|uniref:DUF218 domain-containing protein n=1 Tax=Phascolomyces articulosus TaxID=60185 RepID=A0AAD5KBR3_9FUNG|nr:hypothetical protein BDA99DRAFT_491753 [Phascolomyces articulosus]